MTEARAVARTRRAWAFTHAVATYRRDASGSVVPEEYLRQLLELSVSGFCAWSAVELVDEAGERELLAARRAGCDQTDRDHASCCASALVEELAAAADLRARASRTSLVPSVHDGPRRVVARGLLVRGRVVAVATFGFDEPVEIDERSAVEDATWLIAEALERVDLSRASRDAVRQTQRIASQLHQLIAASLVVSGQRDEGALLVSLAESARGVFNADVAAVSYAARRAIAERGHPSVVGPSTDPAVAWPAIRPHAREAWRDGPWLVVSLPGRPEAPGAVAVRRDAGPDFTDEDREVITLLAQMVATSLGAAELSREIEASEARLRVLIDAAPVGIVEIDVGGSIRQWNRAAGRVFGWGDTGSVVDFPESTREGFAELWAALAREGGHAVQEFVDVEIAGRTRFLTAAAAVLPPIAGVSPGVLALIDDVTDHRQLQSEMRHAQTMETRGQVASKLAHDFNNLLTLITGYAELLALDVAQNERAVEMVRGIQSTTSRASLLTGQLQTIGRTKATAPVVFSPHAVIESNAEVLERILGPLIDVALVLSDEDVVVRVDPDQFEQMVLNLALNARDAMPEGGELRVALSAVELNDGVAAAHGVAAGSYARLDVRDNGVGMDESTRARCFEPLFTTKGPFKGTGVGLAAARRFVEDGGGTITCESTVGEGTTFTVLLPMVEGVAEDVATSASDVRVTHAASILVVEDEEGLRRLMSQVLRRNGFRVIEADSGEAALAHLADHDDPIDLLVSDVLMGEMTGATLAAVLQSRDASLSVLLVSGTESEEVLDGLVGDSSAFLAKPFKPSQLIDRVDELLSRRARAS